MIAQKAIDFIVNLKYDRNLRKKLNQLSPEEVDSYLKTIGYNFTTEQFEKAVNYYNLRCPSEKLIPEFQELNFWHRFLTSNFQSNIDLLRE